MSKPFIVLGDKTSHGGKVVSGCTTATTHGKPIARLGDKVTCPKCGPTTIASGDSTQIVMGKPVARHGDKTACGATLISSQSVTAISSGSSQGGQGSSSNAATAKNSSNATSTSHSAGTAASSVASTAPALAESSQGHTADKSDSARHRTTFAYKSVMQEYAKYQLAYLLVEGAGINGGYSIEGHIRVEGSTLWVNALGRTPVSRMGSIDFFGKISVTRAGQTIIQEPLSLSEPADWPSDGRLPVGSVTATLPTPQDATPLELTITIGYVYRTSAGEAVPNPGTTSETYAIEVLKNVAE